MQEYVEHDWEPAVYTASKKPKPEPPQKVQGEVPFFPSQWKKNANDIFNEILNGAEPEHFPRADKAVYDDLTHASVHRKAFEF